MIVCAPGDFEGEDLYDNNWHKFISNKFPDIFYDTDFLKKYDEENCNDDNDNLEVYLYENILFGFLSSEKLYFLVYSNNRKLGLVYGTDPDNMNLTDCFKITHNAYTIMDEAAGDHYCHINIENNYKLADMPKYNDDFYNKSISYAEIGFKYDKTDGKLKLYKFVYYKNDTYKWHPFTLKGLNYV